MHAQQIVIYRCTDASGQVTLQNDAACPAGSREEKQAVEAPAVVPAFVPPSLPALYSPPVATHGMPESPPKPGPASAAMPAVERVPPTGLFQCRTWDQSTYFTEEATPQQHCAPLQVVGIDGVSRPQASACEMVADQCEAVPAEALCAAWKHRIDEAEFHWRFAGPNDRERKREYDALAEAYASSSCVP